MAMEFRRIFTCIAARPAGYHTQAKIDEPAVSIGKLTVIHAPVFGIFEFYPAHRAEHFISNHYRVTATDTYCSDCG
jgi:hypothetical protein